jgi:hypothetical protein
MRLIDATTLELRNYMDESLIPPYAILSHTWGSDEVTLQQFTDQSLKEDSYLKRSQGYWKILQTCQQALGDGISLVWVDTCCIDKTSSAELSEAINSMYRWYQKAHVCYAYLDDVNVYGEDGVQEVVSNVRFSEDELAKSRWFTRGWTLQELIAPTSLSFFGKGWRFLEFKTHLFNTLGRITGIDAKVLSGTVPIGDESIAKRMSWMARRTTTRSEDMAYALMGIFDVNMPLLYGEGKKAFIRLQEEIMKDSADHSLFAWTADGKWLNSVFASHPSQFSGSSGICSRRFDDKYRLEESHALTNRGVRIKLRTTPYEARDLFKHGLGPNFLAILECSYEESELEDCWPGIVIRKLAGSQSQYLRIAGARIVPTTVGKLNDAQKKRGVISLDGWSPGEWVYIRKKVPGWAQT